MLDRVARLDPGRRETMLRDAFPDDRSLAALLVTHMGPVAESAKMWIYESAIGMCCVKTIAAPVIARKIFLLREKPRTQNAVERAVMAVIDEEERARLRVCLDLMVRQEGLTEFGQFERADLAGRRRPNNYAIVGVSPLASRQNIRSAVLTLEKALHPNPLWSQPAYQSHVVGSRTIAEWVCLVNAAKDILLHSKKRPTYDIEMGSTNAGKFRL